jgi:hypothetical protein
MRIGIDLGGTKIEIIALDDNGATLVRHRVPTPTGDYIGTLNAIADLVLLAERDLCRKGTLGIAVPGAISTRTGVLKNSNSAVLIGKPLARDLSQKLGRPIRLENDANCFALSEAVDGAAASAHVVFGAISSTQDFPIWSRFTLFQITSTHPSSAPLTVTLAGSAEPLGYGRPHPPSPMHQSRTEWACTETKHAPLPLRLPPIRKKHVPRLQDYGFKPTTTRQAGSARAQ